MSIGLRKIAAVAVLLGAAMMGVCAAQGSEGSESAVKAFLQGYLKGPEDKTTRYSVASVRLSEGSKDIFVYIAGRFWCGSGGCTALLLQPTGASFKVIDRFTLVRLPISILPSKTNGWNDLAMKVQGGGIVHGETAILKFNGHRYPTNPSAASKLSPKLAEIGMEVPLTDQGDLLY